MLKRLRDTVKDAIASGDQEAQQSFTSGIGTLKAMTPEGLEIRGTEIQEYGKQVVAVDGHGDRVHRLDRRR
ncbi:hypothetical protein ACFYOY_35930 [Streptomyces sp. NPDC007875]|uniref:hypothetical protein n=1 Tax=Streptomyces sp. NPDC007875 TaxID=3364783 RepID=UPI0036C91BE4